MTMTEAAAAPDSRLAGLRTKLVSRLTGLSARQLGYWHRSDLLEATMRPGQRGIPRLYSWIDYVRLRLAADLSRAEVPTRRIREAVDFLNEHYPDWYLLPERPRAEAKHVLVRPQGSADSFIADGSGQFVLDLPTELWSIHEELSRSLEALARDGGDLGELRNFSDAVVMRPGLNLAQPTVRGTALETRFVAGMAGDVGIESVARLYRVEPAMVTRAVEFEKEVA